MGCHAEGIARFDATLPHVFEPQKLWKAKVLGPHVASLPLKRSGKEWLRALNI